MEQCAAAVEERGRYSASEVAVIVRRLSTAVGVDHAADIDVRAHLVEVARIVLRGRERLALMRRYAWKFASTERPLWLVSADRILLAVSASAAASLGYERAELVGHSTAVLTPSGHDAAWAARRRVIEQQKIGEGIAHARAKDGQVVAVAYRARLVPVQMAILVQTKVLVPLLTLVAA
jgi:PAS domain S-box-containing protein